MTLILSGTNGVSDIDGDASTPAVRGTDANTGIFFGSDVIGFSEGGTECARFNADAQFVAAAGTASLPVITTTGDVNTGIFFPAADTIAFAEGGAEAMRINSSGNLLVGTTAAVIPSAITPKFCLEGLSNDASTVCFARDSNDVGAPNLYFAKSRGTTLGSKTIVQSGDFLGIIGAVGADGSDFDSTAAEIRFAVDGTPGANDMPGRIEFRTTADGASTSTERMRIDSSGNVGIGRSPTQKLDIYGASGNVFGLIESASIGNGQQAMYDVVVGTRAGSLGVYKHAAITNPCAYLGLVTEDSVSNYLWPDNSDVLRISTNSDHIGTTSGTVVGTQTSDERLKDISGPVTYGLNEVLAIEPIAFTMKDDPNIAKIGFSAQQVQPIVPEAVYDTRECIDGYTENEETKEQIPNSDRTKLAMEYTQLIPVLVNAVKELKAELDTVKAELATLKG